MKKETALKALENARDMHTEQMEKIKQLLDGNEIKEPTPLSKMQCCFGEWLYSTEYNVEETLGSQFYENLDRQHQEWHIGYAKIYNIFYPHNQKKGFFSSLIGTHKVNSLEVDKAKLYYTELQEVTKELLHYLASSQRRLQAMNESKFH